LAVPGTTGAVAEDVEGGRVTVATGVGFVPEAHPAKARQITATKAEKIVQ